uniref:Uncharacterized protein n=1 Tax=Setaria viridis TaxID=4556 RepID=A0A4U6VTE1_SETVI|nr:hypothetical protein SEVIR_2G178100v2 [Setaria viridis]
MVYRPSARALCLSIPYPAGNRGSLERGRADPNPTATGNPIHLLEDFWCRFPPRLGRIHLFLFRCFIFPFRSNLILTFLRSGLRGGDHAVRCRRLAPLGPSVGAGRRCWLEPHRHWRGQGDAGGGDGEEGADAVDDPVGRDARGGGGGVRGGAARPPPPRRQSATARTSSATSSASAPPSAVRYVLPSGSPSLPHGTSLRCISLCYLLMLSELAMRSDKYRRPFS